MITLSVAQPRTHPALAAILGGVVYLLAAIALAFFPLGRSVGMEYSLVLSIVAALLSPALATFAGAALIGHDPRVMIESLIAVLLPTLVPPVVTGLIFILLPSCDVGASTVLYLLGPPASALLSLTVVALIGRFLSKPWLVAVLAYAVLFSSLALTLRTLYQEPPTFFLNHFFGAYYGVVYDETAGIDSRLITFRLLTWLWALGGLLLVRASLRKPGRVVRRAPLWSALFLLSALGLSIFWGPSLHPTREAIEKQLGRHVKTPHFDIYLDRSVDAKELHRVALDHEFRYAQIKSQLGVVPQQRVKSFIYPSAAQKAQMMGAGGTQLARPWQLEMHLNAHASPHPVLAHELVHVLSADMGSGPLKTSSRFGLWIRPGLIEGLAVALEPDDDELSLIDEARALRQMGKLPKLDQMLSLTGFSTEAPARAYVAAGALMRFLLEKHGVGRVREFYRSADFSALAGESAEQVQTAWEAWLDAAPPSQRALEMTRRRFERSSFFARRCVHAVQAQYAEVNKAIEAADWPEAYRLLNLRHQEQIEDLRAAQMLMRVGLEAGRLDWLQLGGQWIRSVDKLTAVEQADLLHSLMALHWRKGDLAASCSALGELNDDALPSSQRRLGLVLSQACEWREADDPAVQQAIGAIFEFLLGAGPSAAGGRADLLALEQVRVSLNTSSHPMAQVINGTLAYLIGRQLVQTDPERAEALLGEFLSLPMTSIELRQAGLLLRAEAALRVEHWVQADKDLQQVIASNFDPYGRQAKDLLQRLQFEKTFSGTIEADASLTE